MGDSIRIESELVVHTISLRGLACFVEQDWKSVFMFLDELFCAPEAVDLLGCNTDDPDASPIEFIPI